MKLSVCYMVKNEEKNIPTSLESVKNFADEIIVVDTGSVDRTKSIADSYGAIVYDYLWQDDFSAPRNFAIEHAKGEWIIFPDADESFPITMTREKIELFLSNLNDIDAVMLRRFDVENLGGKIVDNSHWNARIFRNSEELRYRGRIHEELSRKGGELRIIYAPENFYFLHTGYAKNKVEYKSKRNLELLNKVIAEEGEHPVYDYYLTDCYYGIKNYAKALDHATNYLRGEGGVYDGESHMYHMVLECMRAMGKNAEDMLPWADEACEKYPELPEFYAEKGMILCGMGDLPYAKQMLIDALEHYDRHSAKAEQESYFSSVVAAKVSARLGEICMRYSMLDEAAIWFKRAMDYCDYEESVLAKVRKFIEWADREGDKP